MTESDLRLHLARQTKKRIALLDILKINLPPKEALAELKRILKDGAEVVLFDALYQEQLGRIGELIDSFAHPKRPLFSIGSSGIEMALGMFWNSEGRVARVLNFHSAVVKGDLCNSSLRRRAQILVGSGSCSPVTSQQINWALRHRFAEVALDAELLATSSSRKSEVERAARSAVGFLQKGRSVIVHTTRAGSDKRIAAKLKHQTANVLGTSLGQVLRSAIAESSVRRLCIAGGDTSGFAARALGIEALEMTSPLTPGAPLCRAFAPGSPVDAREIVFKGGQVGGEDYFEIVANGHV